jgi:hypothetical protein
MNFGAVSGILRHAALVLLIFYSVIGQTSAWTANGANLTLAWDPISDPGVAGYRVYYGSGSRVYTNSVAVGTTSVTISNLAPGTTYYFAVTTVNTNTLESDYSAEASYTPPLGPVNYPPTLNSLADRTVNENSGATAVQLSGIGSGSSTENQPLAVSAFSSNPTLIPNPALSYTSPDATGTLTFTPAVNSFGSALMTVMVDDGGIVSNTVIRSFTITVNQVVTAPVTMTNAIIAPNQMFRFVLNPPYNNGDHFNYSLDATAPAGARISNRRGVTALVWVPASDQASTTNLITIRVTDTTTPALSTNEAVQVTVKDYLSVLAGTTAVQAGLNASIPISVTSSEGVTNLSFALGWPTNRLSNPALAVSSPTSVAGTLQAQGTNLLVTIRSLSGLVINGSNLVAQLNFQTAASQSSAFVSLPVSGITASKPNGAAYIDFVGNSGQVAVVNDLPMLLPANNAPNRALQLYGRVGTSYQLQSSTNLANPNSWSLVMSYVQTNSVQSVNVGASSPVIFYRVKR